MELNILDNGDLEISIIQEDKEYIQRNTAETVDIELLWLLMDQEGYIGNNWVLGEAGDILPGSLSEAPVILYDFSRDDAGIIEYQDDEKIWVWNKFMTQSFIDDLLEDGKVIFKKAF